MGMHLYPNPAFNSVHLVFEGNSIPEKISLYNITGKLLYEILGKEHLELNVSSYEKGFYLLRTSDGRTKKIILH